MRKINRTNLKNDDGQILDRQRGLSSNLSELADLFSLDRLPVESVSRKNCENLIGSVVLPVGVAGQLTLKINDKHIDAFIPLATTEGALVASVNRGCKAMQLSGGVSVFVERVGITRAPVFRCANGGAATSLKEWIKNNEEQLSIVAQSTSSHLKLLSHQSWVRGRHLYTRFVFDSDEAMGMNMATIASQKIADCIFMERKAELVSISSNVCADKKDSGINQAFGRGYSVQAESILSIEVLREVLKTDRSRFFNTHIQKNLVGSNVALSFSQNGHVANVLAAFYLATGQDPAHVVDGSRAFLTIEPIPEGIYCALTIPSVLVGTVGGGTYLPAQSQARKLISEDFDLSAIELAGVVGGAALAGELSLLASLSVSSLAQAHKDLGRGTK